MKPDKKILVFTDWYVPGYKAGGPIRSIHNMVQALPFDFWIITSSYDHNSLEPYPGITPDIWIDRSENEHVFYSSPGKDMRVELRDLLRTQKFRKFYFNSLFSPKFTIGPLRFLRKYGIAPHQIILAPRGMLKEGALSVKPLKKKVFFFVSGLLGWFDGICWHATSEAEKLEILNRYGKKASVKTAVNLPTPPGEIPDRIQKKAGELRLVALSRVSPEKNILGGISFLNAAAETSGGEITWDIYGTLQNAEYLAECRKVSEANPHVHVHFHGEISHNNLERALAGHHFFFLPTLGENYGHSIAEALQHSLPLLISDRTPWRHPEIDGCGFAVSISGNHMIETLAKCVAMNDSEHAQICAGALAKGTTLLHDENAIRANIALFE